MVYKIKPPNFSYQIPHLFLSSFMEEIRGGFPPKNPSILEHTPALYRAGGLLCTEQRVALYRADTCSIQSREGCSIQSGYLLYIEQGDCSIQSGYLIYTEQRGYSIQSSYVLCTEQGRCSIQSNYMLYTEQGGCSIQSRYLLYTKQ